MSSPAIINTPKDRLIGIALMCLALVFFSCLDTMAKWLGREIDPLQVTWARYTSSIIIVFVFINPWTHPGVMRTKKPVLQGVRSVLMFLSTVFNFVALQYLQLAETISIIFITPFLVALISGPLLGEWVGPRRLAAICVGFLGVLIVLRPGFGGLHPAALLSIAGCICYAVYIIITRKLAASDSAETTMSYSGLAGLLLTPFIGLFWVPPPSLTTWALMLATGLFGTLGHWCLIKGHHLAPAAVLSPFIYTQMIWMVLLGWLVFGQWPDHWTLTGGAVVIASGLYLLSCERNRRKDPVI